MGRQVVLVQRYPVSAPSLVMPPLPPRPPKKRYLLENPPLRPPPIQDDSVPLLTGPMPAAPATVAPLVASAPTDGPVNLASSVAHCASPPIPPPNGVNGNHCGATNNTKTIEEQPLNLSTSNSQDVYHPNNQEVHLSNIVDRVVEKMLWKRSSDSARSGDPLRAWFSNQFETRQRSDGSSSSGDSPVGGTGRPHSASPRLSGVDAEKDRCRDLDPDPDRDRLSHGSGGVLEVTIGMSETISRVIDNVYRQDSVGTGDRPDPSLLGRRGSAPVVRDTASPPAKRRPVAPAVSVAIVAQERVSVVESLASKCEAPRGTAAGTVSPHSAGGRLSPRQAALSPRPSGEEVSPSSDHSPASSREVDSPSLMGGRITTVTSVSAPVTVPSPTRGAASAPAPTTTAGDPCTPPGGARPPQNTTPATAPGTDGRSVRVMANSPRPGPDSPHHRGSSPRPSGPPARPQPGPPRTVTGSPSRRGRKRGLPAEPIPDADCRNPAGGNSDSSVVGGQ